MKHSNNLFDHVRLIAALLVLFSHHFAVWGFAEPYVAGITLGHLGVAFFFSISGYLVTQSLYADSHFGRFMTRRILRIAPGLAANCLFCAIALGGIVTTLPISDYLTHPATWTYFVQNCLLNPQFHLPGVFANAMMPSVVNGSLWTLPFEVAGYLVLATSVILSLKKPTGIALVGLALALVAQEAGWPSNGTVYWGSDWAHFPGFMVYFFVGSLAARWSSALLSWKLVGALILLAIFVRDSHWLTPLMSITLPLLLLVIAKVKVPASLALKSDISYGVYLYAFPLQQASLATANTLGFWGSMLLATILTVTLAWLSWHAFEKPALELKPGRPSTNGNERPLSIIAMNSIPFPTKILFGAIALSFLAWFKFGLNFNHDNDWKMLNPQGDVSRGAYIKAAHWFGDAWPVNFWNTRLEQRADADFQRIREDGFNTVVLVLPWSGFSPDGNTGNLDIDRARRLSSLVRTAAHHGLKVIVRLSFAWDARVANSGARLVDLWVKPVTYDLWIDHLRQLWALVSQEPNFLFGFVSWEDLWAPTAFGSADINVRLSASRTTGFQRWLEQRYSIDTISTEFRETFRAFDEVPIPKRNSPAFRIFFEFIDYQWRHRFFEGARSVFPGLSMEVRVDQDPIYDGEHRIGSYGHESSWDLGNAEWITLYWSPAMGGVNQGGSVSPSDAINRLKWILEKVRAVAPSQKIFIGQMLIQDFTPGFEHNERLNPSAVSDFLDKAKRPMEELTGGYGLWAWKDYFHDSIPNPEFQAGLDGWTSTNSRLGPDGTVTLDAGSALVRHITRHEFHEGATLKFASVCMQLKAENGRASFAKLYSGGTKVEAGTFLVTNDWTDQCIQIAVEDRMNLELRVTSETKLRSFSVKGALQASGMRNTTGARKPIAESYVKLNSLLRGTSTKTESQFPDKWIGKTYDMRVRTDPDSTYQLVVQPHLPDHWPVETTLDISINGQLLASTPCKSAPELKFELPQQAIATRLAHIHFTSSDTWKAPGDTRNLGCLLSPVRVERTGKNTRLQSPVFWGPITMTKYAEHLGAGIDH